jgi:ferritin-like metal-binding protein YciE
MPIQSFEDLLLHELKDLYDAEHQIVKALPKMAKTVYSSELKAAFEDHLDQSQQHIRRLEQVFETLNKKPARETCEAMKGLIAEGDETMQEKMDGLLKDAALIAAAQRVEHYEMAGYGTVRTFANLLGYHEASQLLQMTLDEEEQTDKLLSQIANGVNVAAMEEVAAPRK